METEIEVRLPDLLGIAYTFIMLFTWRRTRRLPDGRRYGMRGEVHPSVSSGMGGMLHEMTAATMALKAKRGETELR